MNEIEKNDQALIEGFAAMEHARWARWQEHLHFQCFTSPEFTGALIIPADLVVRWRHQISTPYSQLSEKDKEKDRNEVRPYFEHMQTLLAQKNKEREEAIEATIQKCIDACDDNIKIEQRTHRRGAHSDDFGGEADYPCDCDEKERRYKIDALTSLKKRLQALSEHEVKEEDNEKGV